MSCIFEIVGPIKGPRENRNEWTDGVPLHNISDDFSRPLFPFFPPSLFSYFPNAHLAALLWRHLQIFPGLGKPNEHECACEPSGE
jgi:hypothetical protein